MRLSLLCIVIGSLVHKAFSVQQGIQKRVEQFFEASSHTNNWVVLVCTSRFWFNYRHVANVLSLYHSVKRLGIPDSNIILMLADDMPCNPRNPKPGTVFNSKYQHINLYGTEVEVDYRGYEVSVENFVRVMTGRVHPATPRSKRLLSDHQSNVLVYLTGHGGDGFLKFQDSEELTNVDLADAIETMFQSRVHPATPRSKRLLSDHQSNVLVYLTGHGGDGFLKFQDSEELTNVDLADAIETMFQSNRYNELLLIADTCQSESMYQRVYSANVLATSSSLVGEDSLSYDVDLTIGVYIIDRYTHFTLEFLERQVRSLNANRSMQDYFNSCPHSKCLSTVGVRTDLYPKDPARVRITDFFGSTRNMRAVSEEIVFDDDWLSSSPLNERIQTTSQQSSFYVETF
ncbi:Putative GPI-anchor transamidase [Toxocara canis]|uniref:Putative GPI-anchor transamidase n=1 Tax=Toxocara canis TaxID=6265 RepID=A0A0B2VTT8_TOXCA|nr:Putative GPI-anchor transamidase [Toxocara canis]